MIKQDEYIIYINIAGSKFYYKNKKLHRENGPAYFCNKNDDVHLLVEENYQEIIQNPFDDQTRLSEKFQILNKDLWPFSCQFFLEGVNYSEEDFIIISQKIKLKDELKENLVVNEKATKKIKL